LNDGEVFPGCEGSGFSAAVVIAAFCLNSRPLEHYLETSDIEGIVDVTDHYAQRCDEEALIFDIYWNVPTDRNTDYLSYEIQRAVAEYFGIDVDQVHVTILSTNNAKRQQQSDEVVTISILVSDPQVSAASPLSAVWSLLSLFVFIQAWMRC